MKKRILALILASLMLLSATACSDAGTDNEGSAETAAPSADNAATEETVPEETEIPVNLPDKTYDGEEVMFLTSLNTGYDWYTSYEIYAAELNGELINDSVFQRNATIEERLDIKIAETKLSDCHVAAKESIVAGDGQFDVIMPYLHSAMSMAVEGSMLDLKQIPYLDLEKPWWDQRANENLQINDRLFISTGDIAILDNECTMVMFFNKDLVTEFGMESPYDLVLEGKWTMDALTDMALQVTIDKDGDGKMTNDDLWGISIADNAPISFFFSAGERVVKEDENGELQLMLGSPRAYDVFDKIATLCYDNQVLSRHTTGKAGFDDVCLAFKAGNVMFVTFALVDINGLRDSEYEFGILPYPKYDEAQEEYNNLISTSIVSATSVPNTCQNPELTGVTLEAMAYYSVDTLTTAYYDNALKSRYVRDEESGKMLDIIFATRVYDLGFIFNWGNAGNLVTSLYTGKQTEYASGWEKIEKAAQKTMEKAIKQFAEIP